MAIGELAKDGDTMHPTTLDWLISVDDHILEPPDLWVDRVPSKDRDRAPRMVRDGVDEYWLYEDKRMPTLGPERGRRQGERGVQPRGAALRRDAPGCYDPVARLEDMDRAGVLASLCFPTLPRFCGQLFYEAADQEFGFVCLQTYNDWVIDDWCAGRARSLHPAHADPALGPAARGQGDGALRGEGRDRVRVLGEPGTARPAHHPRPEAATGTR